jgi:hypothetical protein
MDRIRFGTRGGLMIICIENYKFSEMTFLEMIWKERLGILN